MTAERAKAHLLFIVGPTACGKSDLAVEISENAAMPRPEIINSDSVSFFEAVQIGAAKPGPELLSRARHHLIGHVGKHERYTAGDFRRDALTVIEERAAISPKFLVVGGSGFYAQALEKGMYDVGPIPAEVRDQLARESNEPGGMETLYLELKNRDPETAARLAPADHYRILRALEVLRTDPRGLTMGEIKSEFERTKPEQPFTAKKIGLFRPRETLRQKITERTRAMLNQGLIEEVVAFRAEGLGDWWPLQSVGYKEVQAFLDGVLAKNDLEAAIVTSTMQLAKQQMTWFKRDPNTQWFETDKDWAEAVRTGVQLLD